MRRSGRGQIVDVALTESLITMLESVIPEYGYLGMIRERTGNIAHNSAPTNAFPCADGAVVCIAANTTRLFRGAVPRRSVATTTPTTRTWRPTRVACAEPPSWTAVIAAWTRTRTGGDVVALLREHQIPVSRINSIADIAADPQVLAREMIVAVDDDRLDRPLLVPGIAPKLSRTPGRVPALARPLGADTAAVRAQFGGPATTPWPMRPGPVDRGPARRGRPPTSRLSPAWAPSRHSGGRWTEPTSGPSLIHEHVFVRNLELEGSVPGLTFDPDEAIGAGGPRPDHAASAGVRTVVDLTVPGLGRAIPLVAAVAAPGPAASGRRHRLLHGGRPAALLPVPRPGPADRRARSAGGDVHPRHRGRDRRDAVRAGMIKVMTGAAGWTPDVVRVMTAAATAHARTGVTITTHSVPETRNGLEQQAFLREHGRPRGPDRHRSLRRHRGRGLPPRAHGPRLDDRDGPLRHGARPAR